MEQLGNRNPSNGLETIGFSDLSVVRYNFEAAELL
ncbi:hypothetical protein ABIA22_003579 [Sinorhizobium fredii]